MPTQEEFIRSLISRLQPVDSAPVVQSQFTDLSRLPASQFPMQQVTPRAPEAGSLASGFAQPQPVPPQPIQPPPSQDDLNLFGGFDKGFLPSAPPIKDESQDYFMQAGRGFGRGVAQGTITLGQGLFATADMVTNLAGYEDAIDPETSEALKSINEAREFVGNEEGMVGKLAEALGSMVPLLVPGFGAAAATARAGALATKGAGYAEAARRTKNLAKGLRATTAVVATNTGAGTANQMLESYANAGNAVTNAQRNLSTAFGLGIGLTELAPLEILLRGVPRSLGKNVVNRYAVRAAQNITNAGAEGGQEAIAGIMQELAAQGNYNPNQPIGDSALSDFGYGSAAGSIIDGLFGRKFRLPKTEKQLQVDHQGTEELQLLDDDFLKAAQTNEQDVAFYNNNGEKLGGQVINFGDDFVTLSVGEDIIDLPRNQMPDPNTGNSFASDQDLLTSRFSIDGVQLGDMTTEQVADRKNLEMLPDALRAQVDSGTLSLNDAIEAARTDTGELETVATPDKIYRIKALVKELNRRSPDAAEVLTEKAADQQARAAAGVELDSGEFGDSVEAQVEGRVPDVLSDTVIGRTVGGKVSETLVGEAALNKAMKGVSKKDRADYFLQVGASPDVAYDELSAEQKINLLDLALTHKQRKAEAKKAQEQKETEAATEAEVARKAQALASAQQESVVVPSIDDQAGAKAEEIIEEQAAAPDATPTPVVEPPVVQTPQPKAPEVTPETPAFEPITFDSKTVRDAKPRYKTLRPEFESDVDKALYIVRDSAKRSKADEGIMQDLRVVLPGMTDAQIRQLGEEVRQSVKERGEQADGLNLSEFAVPTIVPQATSTTAQEVVVEEDAAPDSESTSEIKLNLIPDSTTPEPKTTEPKSVKPTLPKTEQVVATPKERADLREAIGVMAGDNAKAIKLGTEAYQRRRNQGESHEEALDAFAQDPDFQDAALDFARREQGVAPEGELFGVAGTETAKGVSGMLVSQSGEPLDFNAFQRIKKIVSDVAPTSELVVASQLYGQVVNRDGDVKYVINGKEVNYESALGLQMGNIVGVSLSPEGSLDPENVAYHEATHFLVNNGFLTEPEMKSLIANIPRLEQIVLDHLGQAQYDRAMSGNEFQNFNELIAYGSALYNRGLDVDGKIPKEFNPALRRIFAKIAKLFKRLKAQFTGEFVPMEVEQVFEQIRQGRAGQRKADPQSTQRIKQAMLSEDPTGLSAATPLFVIKQGPIAGSSSFFVPDRGNNPTRPAFKSAMKTKLEGMASQKKLPQAWGRVEGTNVVGALSGVKVEEWNDSNISSFLDTLPQDKSVSGEELLEYFNDIEQIVEVQVYGTPLGPKNNQDSETRYRAALQEDRNNLGYEQIANDAMTLLRTGSGKSVVTAMQIGQRIRQEVPNQEVVAQAYPVNVIKALDNYAAALDKQRDSFDDLPDPVKEKLQLVKELNKTFKQEDMGFSKKSFGLSLVDASYKGSFNIDEVGSEETKQTPLAGFKFITDMLVESDGQMEQRGSRYGTQIGDIPNFYFKWTSMGGRALSDQPSKGDAGRLKQDLGQREIIYTAPLAAGTGTTHAHFPDVRNPLMHIRLTDIILDNGEAVLVVEEVQSDVHQAANELMRNMATQSMYDSGQITSNNFQRLSHDEKNLVRPNISKFKDEVYGKLLPDLPLKKENQRIAFAMQQIVRMAVNGGYDHIAVSNSELQVERYRDEYKASIDGLVMTQIADIGLDGDTIRSLAGQQKSIEVSTSEGSFVVTQNDVEQELEALIERGIMAPATPDPYTGTYVKQEELGGMPFSDEAILDESEIEDIKEKSESDARESLQEFFDNEAAQMVNFESLRAGTLRAADGELVENIDVSPMDAVRLAFSRAMIRVNPSMRSSWVATYTTPVIGLNDQGQTVMSNFQRSTIELGNAEVSRQGNPRLDDWLGQDVALLVRNQLNSPQQSSNEFGAPDFIQFIQQKVASAQQQKERLNSGDNEVTAYEQSEAELMDVDSMQGAVNKLTGAIDVPVGGGFENIYDRKIPQALESALASLLDGNLKKAKKKVRENNVSKRLYLGSGHSLAQDVGVDTSISEELGEDALPIEQSQIINVDQIEGMPRRARYVGDEGTSEGQALALALAESEQELQMREGFDQDFDSPVSVAQEQGLSPEQRYMIPVSNRSNALRVYTLTPEMESSPKVIEPTDIYFAQIENDRTSATNKGIDDKRNMTRSGRQKAVDYINGMPFFNTLKDMPQKREFYLERSKYLGVVTSSSDIATYLRNEIGNQFLFRSGDKNRGSTEALRGSIFNYMTTGNAEQEQALLSQLEALDPRAAAAATKAKDMIESLGLEMVQAGLLNPKTFYENRRSYLPRVYIKHILENPRDERFGYLKKRNEDLTPEDQEALGVINELDPAFLVSRAIQRPVRDLQFIEFMNSIAGNNAWTVDDDQLVVTFTDVNGVEQQQSGLYLLDEVNTLNEIAKAIEVAEPDRATRLKAQAKSVEQSVLKTFEERGLMQYINEPGRDIIGDTQGYGNVFKRVPRGKQYGMLAGRLVRSEIYDNVIASTSLLNVGDQAAVNLISKGKKLTAIWKTIKVPLNPPTIARNTFSNAILIHLSGVPWYRVLPRMVEATREIVAYNNGDFANSKHYQEMLARGVKQSSFTDQELVLMQDDMLDFLRSVDAKDLGLIGWLKLNTWQRLAQKASNIYQGIEVVGKTAIAIDVMDRQGGSADDAFLKAQEYLFDYSDVPETVKKIRQSPVGIPFLTFQYKVLPVLAKTALRNPMRFAPYVALSYALPALFMNAFDIDDDEYEKIKKAMPDYIRGNPGLIPIPARDGEGRLQFLDTAYLYPWGSFSGILTDLYMGGKKLTGNADPAEKGVGLKDFTSAIGMFGGPAWSLFGAAQNLDPFTQRPIVNPEDPMFISGAIERPFYNRGKVTDAMFWAANQYLLPGFLNTEYGAVSKLNTALKGDKKSNGVAPDTVMQSSMRFVGLNLINVDPLSIKLSLEYLNAERSKLITALNRVKRDQSLSPRERNRRLSGYYEQLYNYRLKKKALVDAGYTATSVTRRLKRQDEKK